MMSEKEIKEFIGNIKIWVNSPSIKFVLLEKILSGPPRYSVKELEKIFDYMENDIDIRSNDDPYRTLELIGWIKENPVKVKKILEE